MQTELLERTSGYPTLKLTPMLPTLHAVSKSSIFARTSKPRVELGTSAAFGRVIGKSGLQLCAGMHYNITNVGFYDAMSVNAVDYIMNQTELTTIFCEGGLVKKIVGMKNKG